MVFCFLSKVVHFVYQLVSGRANVYIFAYNVAIVTLEADCNFIKMKVAYPLEFIRYPQYNLFLPKICSSVVSLEHSISFKILVRFLINILSVDALSFIFYRRDDNKDIDSDKEAAMEAEIKAARERAIVPLEARMKQFKDMLLERGVRKQSLGEIFLFCISNINMSC